MVVLGRRRKYYLQFLKRIKVMGRRKRKTQALLEYIILFIIVVSCTFLTFSFVSNARTNIFENHFEEVKGRILGE